MEISRHDERRIMNRRHLKILMAALVLGAQTTIIVPIACADLLVGSFNTNSVLRYDETTGAFLGVFASGGGLDRPLELLFGPDGNLYVTSFGTDSVLRYNETTGVFIDAFVPAGSGGLAAPQGAVFGPDGNLYVSSADSVLRYSGTTGTFIDAFVPSGTGGLVMPIGVTFGPDANLYVAAAFNVTPSLQQYGVLRFDGATGAFIDLFIDLQLGALGPPSRLLFGPDGNLYLYLTMDPYVERFDGATGAFIDRFIVGGGGGFAFDLAFGRDGELYVSSFADGVLRYNETTGAFTDVFIPPGSGVPDGFTALVFTPTGLSQVVSIDIKPRSFPNSINPRSKGVISVAILSTTNFDATSVDPISVEFGSNGALEAHAKGHIEDVNRDGNKDLVLHFSIQETGIRCGDISASLTGETFDGDLFEGSDSMKTVGCRNMRERRGKKRELLTDHRSGR